MIGYVTLGTNNFEKAVSFYDELLAEAGMKRLWLYGDMAAWGTSREQTSLCLTIPFDGNPATAGNGAMVALRVKDKAMVQAVYQKALELGGQNEGEPGPRGEHGFYGGYFRDLDGNKLNAHVPAGG